MAESDNPSRDAALFIQLVAIFQDATMRQLGKLPIEPSGEIVRDLDQARTTIDLIEMLERRTRGNRTDPESQFINRVLLELRMNYVDETGRSQPEEGANGGVAEEHTDVAQDEGAVSGGDPPETTDDDAPG